MRRLIRFLAATVLLVMSHQALAHYSPRVHHHVNQVTRAHTRPHVTKRHYRVRRHYARYHARHVHRRVYRRHFVKSRSRSLANLPSIPYVNLLPTQRVDPRSAECMARVIYYEARGEGTQGMAAVGYVIMNRIKDRRFPSSVCGVVGQSTVIRGKRYYQFSWAGHPPRIHSAAAWERSLTVARRVLNGTIRNPIGDALYFHVRTLRVSYGHRMYAMVLGNHTFLSPLPFNRQPT